MSKTVEEAGKKVLVGEVVRAGERLLIPEKMEIEDAIDLLKRRQKYETEAVEVKTTINCFPQDGAVALFHTLRRIYGWAEMQVIPGGFFRPDQKPELITVEVGYGKTMQVPWGRFSLPNISGWIQTAATRENGRVTFMLVAQCLRMHETTVNDLFEAVRQEAMTNSIYRGRAVRIRFLGDNGKPLDMPSPKFLDTSKGTDTLVYSDRVMQALNTNLFTPIKRVQDCLDNAISVKRGVLLGGTFGTGKTLAAAAAAAVAEAHGITYLYIPRADELSHAILFAQQYQSPACVIFCEDIDRVTSGERSVKMDDILNIIDGIDSKNSNIIVVLTTNALETINPAMLRPGRLDAVIEITPPDGPAVERLIRSYGRGLVSPNENLEKVGQALSGTIPAIIAEVVKRAKLAQLSIQEPGTPLKQLTEAALLDSALTMKSQIDLLERRSAVKAPSDAEVLYEALGKLIDDVNEDGLAGIRKTVAEGVEDYVEG